MFNLQKMEFEMRYFKLFFVLILSASTVFAHNVKRVSGNILFENGEPATGVAVFLEGSVHYTNSDLTDGTFRLNLDSEKGTILVYHKDYDISRIPVKSGSKNIEIVLSKKVIKDPIVALDSEIPLVPTKPNIIPKVDTTIKKYGTLKGKVLDEAGKGLRGASVFIEGTQKGAAVREDDGSYIISGITIGEYSVRYSFTGKSSIHKRIKLNEGENIISAAILRDASVQTIALVMSDPRETVNHTAQGSVDKRINEETIHTAREGLGGVIIPLSPSVLSSGSDISIRGGRDSETDVRVDGMSVGNAFTSGLGNNSQDVIVSAKRELVNHTKQGSMAVITNDDDSSDDVDISGFVDKNYITEDRTHPDSKTLSSHEGSNSEVIYSAGKLTAGEVNDFSKWVMWNDISENELSYYKNIWKMFPKERYTLQISNEHYLPVYGAKISLVENDYVIWSSTSDNTGKAELWRKPFTNRSASTGNLYIEIDYKGEIYYIDSPKQFSEGINFFKIKTGLLKPANVDIAFVVDATSSMDDEINFLKSDMVSVINSIQDTLPDIKINLATVFYRDTFSVEYITRHIDFSSDIKKIENFIMEQEANSDGNHDFPEAVHSGLEVAINQLSWRKDAIAKIIYLVLDASPYTRPYVVARLQELTLKASEMGIRIIPVACSGIEKDGEYFLRSLALLTNGTYTFLTDDSGIGNPHIEPTTDEYKVETLRDILIRLTYQNAYYPENAPMPNPNAEKGSEISISDKENNDLDKIKYYPNPTYGVINIELDGEADELFIADMSGKIIFRINPNGQKNFTVNLAEYPSGAYLIMYQYAQDKWKKGQIMLMH